MGSAPFLGGGFGHFYDYAPEKIEYAINRFAMETKRQLDVLDRRLEDNEYLAGPTIRSPTSRSGHGMGACAGRSLWRQRHFLAPKSYEHVKRWTEQIAARPAVKRGRIVNRYPAIPQATPRAPRRIRFRHSDAGQARAGGRERRRQGRRDLTAMRPRPRARSVVCSGDCVRLVSVSCAKASTKGISSAPFKPCGS